MATDDLLERIKSISQANYPLIKDKLSSVDQVFVLQLTDDGTYVIRVNNVSMSAEPGTFPTPIATLTTTSADLRAILDGQMDAAKAFFQGKVQIKGDIFKTMVLNSLIKGAR
jgi:putative sterol carrier protein